MLYIGPGLLIVQCAGYLIFVEMQIAFKHTRYRQGCKTLNFHQIFAFF